MSGSTPVVFDHYEGDSAGRRQDGDLGVPVAVDLAELQRLVVDGPRCGQIMSFGTAWSVGDRVGRVAVLGDDPQERLAVLRVALERAAVIVAMMLDCLYASPCMIAVRAAA